MTISQNQLCSYDFGKFLGWFLAEGSYEKASCLRFSLSNKEDIEAAWLSNFASTLWGAKTRIHDVGHGSIAVIINSKAAKGCVQEFITGDDSLTKHFTRSVWNQNLSFLSGIVDGWLAGDGSYELVNDRWRFNIGYNSLLVNDIRTACNILGYSMRAHKTTARLGLKQYQSFTGEIRIIRASHGNSRENSEIVSIVHTADEIVYDITVEGNHLFMLPNGILTHNSNPVPQVRKVTMVSSVELIAKIGGRPNITFTKQNEMHNFFEGPIETQNRMHPTQKPLWLMKRLIQTFTKPDDVILDPFMGSGTTLVAAQELRRSAMGVEINPEYCEAANKRLMQQAMAL